MSCSWRFRCALNSSMACGVRWMDRRLFLVLGSLNTIPKYTDRLNGPIQSIAGDILYLTLIKLDADLSAGLHPGTKFLFTAHDEIVLTCPEGIAKEVAAWLKSKMVEALEVVLGPELGGSRAVEV